MSFNRAKSRETNRNVYLDNRLTNLTNPPIRVGDLYIENNETIGNNLDVSGNITVGHDIKARNYYAIHGNYYIDTYLLVPYGTIIQSAAVNIPDGWLDCNGASILKTVYANLFSVIGYTYGGSGNNFNLPDMRGRVVVGVGSGVGLSTRALGSTGGEETHTLTSSEMPAHNHGVTDPGHTHSYVNQSGDQSTDNAFHTESAADQADYNQTTGSSTTGITINNTGGGGAHNNMQPFISMRYLIKY